MKKIKEMIERFRNRQHHRLMAFIISVAISILVLSISVSEIFEKLELTSLDYRFKLRPQQTTNPEIVLIDMAEDSIQSIGHWPWPRSWHATLISILAKYNVKIVGFDVLFSEKTTPEQDTPFSKAIEVAGNVYLPYVFESSRILYPIDELYSRLKGSGHINIKPESDGILRRIPLYIKYNNKLYPQLAFNMMLDYLNVDKESMDIEPGKFIKMRSSSLGTILIPIDKDYQMLINWAGPWKTTFKHYSFIDIIVSYKQILDGLNPRVDLSKLKDKICIIGLTAMGLSDIKPIPVEPSYPAVGVHANIINNILQKNFLRRVDKHIDYIIIILIGMLMSVIVHRLHPIRSALYTILCMILYTLSALYLFNKLNLWIELIAPLVTILVSYLAITLYSQITIAIEKARLFTLATRDGLTGLYVIRHFNLLLETEMETSRRHSRYLSVLLSDIDHFKSFNDTYGHQVGDFVLREVAKIFKASCRQFDVPSRYGGEEFIMMLPGSKKDEAIKVAERYRKAVESNIFKDKDREYRVTVSVGVATLEETDKAKEELVKRADEALYRAKEGGRNQVQSS